MDGRILVIAGPQYSNSRSDVRTQHGPQVARRFGAMATQRQTEYCFYREILALAPSVPEKPVRCTLIASRSPTGSIPANSPSHGKLNQGQPTSTSFQQSPHQLAEEALEKRHPYGQALLGRRRSCFSEECPKNNARGQAAPTMHDRSLLTIGIILICSSVSSDRCSQS